MRRLSRRHVRNRYLAGFDIAGFAIVLFLAYSVRFEAFAWPVAQAETFLRFLPLTIALKVLVFYRAGLYRRLWRYAGMVELERIAVAVLVAAGLSFTVGVWFLPALGLVSVRVPMSVAALDGVLTLVVAVAPRFYIRAVSARGSGRPLHPEARRVLIAGAGSAGELIAKELRANPELSLTPVGFVDDDPAKHGLELSGISILGPVEKLIDYRERCRADEVIVAMPSATGATIRRVMQLAEAAGLRTRTIPGMFELLSGRVAVSALRPIQIEDLLRRDPVRIDFDRVQLLVENETVVVTGAGGSIGSEICRQVAALGPGQLLLLGHGENSIFDITAELTDRYPSVPIIPLIADVRDRPRILQLFEAYRPGLVLHTAAHKHVPLMEINVPEAVSNNVVGTRNVAEAAVQCGAARMVMVSTDKAVRPTNVMGATKRVAEQIVQGLAQQHGVDFISVRFGNVLGSRGSVVPTFLSQIQLGGPITVTHPEMRRYFMTIPESVQLVLQAAVLSRGGEVYALDMGEPVKIVDLAADLIRLSGLEVGRDIEIQFTGVRPGEKLYEEVFFGKEEAEPTEHPKVLRARHAHLPIGLSTVVARLVAGAEAGASDDELRELLQRLVPDYAPEGSAHNIAHRRPSGRYELPPSPVPKPIKNPGA